MFINCVASMRGAKTKARERETDFYDSLNVFAMILSLVRGINMPEHEADTIHRDRYAHNGKQKGKSVNNMMLI